MRSYHSGASLYSGTRPFHSQNQLNITILYDTASSSPLTSLYLTPTLQSFPTFPPIRLLILKRKPTRPLIRARLAGYMTIAGTKQQHPSANSRKQTMHRNSNRIRQRMSSRILRVAVERNRAVVRQRDRQAGHGVGSGGVGEICACGCGSGLGEGGLRGVSYRDEREGGGGER